MQKAQLCDTLHSKKLNSVHVYCKQEKVVQENYSIEFMKIFETFTEASEKSAFTEINK